MDPWAWLFLENSIFPFSSRTWLLRANECKLDGNYGLKKPPASFHNYWLKWPLIWFFPHSPSARAQQLVAFPYLVKLSPPPPKKKVISCIIRNFNGSSIGLKRPWTEPEIILGAWGVQAPFRDKNYNSIHDAWQLPSILSWQDSTANLLRKVGQLPLRRTLGSHKVVEDKAQTQKTRRFWRRVGQTIPLGQYGKF